MYSDGIDPTKAKGAGSRVIAAALAADSAVQHATHLSVQAGTSIEPTTDEYTHFARLLRQIGHGCKAEFERTGCRVFVAHGHRPLHEDRVGEWLRHEPFLAQPPDLLPALDTLTDAGVASGLSL